MIEKLQYITADNTYKSHIALCLDACMAGVKWVQLRMKNVTKNTYLQVAKECRDITKQHNCKLIINDNVGVALEADADGVHLGQQDMQILAARKILGKYFLIGGSANTLEEVAKHINDEVDYVGLGPFRFTRTKKNISPILHLAGYIKILDKLAVLKQDIPIIAVGGIQYDDIELLTRAGVYGVAVSGVINVADNKPQIVKKLKLKLS